MQNGHVQEIRGITVKDKEIKLSQYANDTTLNLHGFEESLLESLKIIVKTSSVIYPASDLTLKRQKLCGLVQARISGILNFVLKRTSNGRKKSQSVRGMVVNGPRFNYIFELQR